MAGTGKNHLSTHTGEKLAGDRTLLDLDSSEELLAVLKAIEQESGGEFPDRALRTQIEFGTGSLRDLVDDAGPDVGETLLSLLGEEVAGRPTGASGADPRQSFDVEPFESTGQFSIMIIFGDDQSNSTSSL